MAKGANGQLNKGSTSVYVWGEGEGGKLKDGLNGGHASVCVREGWNREKAKKGMHK